MGLYYIIFLFYFIFYTFLHSKYLGASLPRIVLLRLIVAEIFSDEWKMKRWKVKTEEEMSSVHF